MKIRLLFLADWNSPLSLSRLAACPVRQGTVSLSHGPSIVAITGTARGRVGGDRCVWHTDPSRRNAASVNKPSGRPLADLIVSLACCVFVHDRF